MADLKKEKKERILSPHSPAHFFLVIQQGILQEHHWSLSHPIGNRVSTANYPLPWLISCSTHGREVQEGIEAGCKRQILPLTFPLALGPSVTQELMDCRRMKMFSFTFFFIQRQRSALCLYL